MSEKGPHRRFIRVREPNGVYTTPEYVGEGTFWKRGRDVINELANTDNLHPGHLVNFSKIIEAYETQNEAMFKNFVRKEFARLRADRTRSYKIPAVESFITYIGNS